MRRAGHDAAVQAGRQWDTFVLSRSLPRTNADADFAETITRLHAADDAPHVDPGFALRLGRRLMAGSTIETPWTTYATAVQPSRIASSNGHHPTAGWNGRRRDEPPRGRLFPWFSLSAVFVVVAVFAVSVIPGRHFGFLDGGNPPHVPAPTFVAEQDATPPSTALYRGDAARTGAAPGPGPEGSPTLAWKNQAGLYHSSVPVVAGNRVFVARGTPDDTTYVLAALDLRTGEELWTAPIDQGPRWVPAVADGLVYLPIGDALVALDEDTGEIVWSYPLEGRMNGFSPVVADGRVYFTVTDFSMRAVDAKTGEEAWRIGIPGLTADELQYEGFVSDASVAAANGVVYAVGSGGLVFAVDADDGHEIWTFRTEGGQPGTPLVVDGVLLVTSIVWEEGPAGTPGRLTALDAASGTQLWGPIVLSSAATITAGGGTVFVQAATSDSASVQALDIQTGEDRWTFEGGGFLDYPVYVDGDLYVSSRDDGTIQRIGAATGTSEWSVYLNAGDPVVVNGLVIASGYDTIYAIGGSGTEDSPDVASIAVDLSGLPACEPPRPVPTAEIEGTPSATIAAETKLIEPEGKPPTYVDGRPTTSTTWPQILVVNVPTGAAASPEETSAARQTFQSMAHCAVRPEGNRLIQGFFTDDFFRRGVAADGPNGYSMTWGLQPEEPEIESLTAMALEDGRIAAVTTINETPHLLVIFVQQDGHWLIDELYKVQTEYFSGPLG